MLEKIKNRLTILLAEDDIDDQELLSEAFASIDPSIELISFSSGKKILNYLDSLSHDQVPRLIILDYNIPELNGAEILKNLNSIDKFHSTIKLVWSTSNSTYYENDCISSGANAYMVKPSSLAALDEMARAMLSFVEEK